NGRATGVEVSLRGGSPLIIEAHRLVVVSGGALGSPLILERSGLGAANVLQAAGIPLLVDLSGAGEN
ncbi:hypothetical protein DFH07DRAFT_709892, partial [Mycena maculata]